MKVLGIAFEPWETEIVAATNAKLLKTDRFDKSGLFVADLYQIHRRRPANNLCQILERFPQQLYTLEREFYSWQKRHRGKINYASKISEWARENAITVSTRVLSSSDHIFSCFERSPYYKPLSEKDAHAIFYYYATKITSVLNEFKPDTVWCIERNYLAKNIFAALCDARKINMQTLVFSRISNQWVFSSRFVDPFGDKSIAEDANNKDYHKSFNLYHLSKDKLSSAQAFLDELRSSYQADKPKTLYIGETEKKNKHISLQTKRPFYWLVDDLVKTGLALAKILLINRTGHRIYPWHYVYLSDKWRVALYTLNAFRRRSLRSFLGIPFASRLVPADPFFYYPLHHRPESSTLTLGRGLSDELAICIISKLIPYGAKLAVKENPMIIDDRRYKFYKELSRIHNIVLISSVVPSHDLMQKSLGVISISGTALLEAVLMDIPAHSVGKPEFLECLNSTGLDSLEDFMVKCMQGAHCSKNNLAEKYVKHCFNCGMSLNLGWQGIRSVEEVDKNASNISALLIGGNF